jgi:hypothetical protein
VNIDEKALDDPHRSACLDEALAKSGDATLPGRPSWGSTALQINNFHRKHFANASRESIRPGEPLPARLYSAKIPRALWLVGFSG